MSVVAPAPDDRVLELGCGPGVAAGLICDRLTTGHLVAVDRSATAVARTAARNAATVEAGRWSVVRAEVGELALPPASATTVFAVNVNLFWTRAPTAPDGSGVRAIGKRKQPHRNNRRGRTNIGASGPG